MGFPPIKSAIDVQARLSHFQWNCQWNRSKCWCLGGLSRSNLFPPCFFSLACLGLLITALWLPALWLPALYLPIVSPAQAAPAQAAPRTDALTIASVATAASLPPRTLGMDSPPGIETLGRELLVIEPSDRLLDREVGDRIQNFWPLQELLLAFNREFRTANVPLIALATCPTLRAETPLEPTYQGENLPLVVCYDLLQQMDDYADDLSGSLTEQHLAVLDLFYFSLARELSRLVLAASNPTDVRSEQAIKLSIKPLTDKDWETFKALPHSAAVDQLTTQLPQRLKLQQQTVILSGTQWLFNQGNPSLSPSQLEHWTGEKLDLENYRRLICNSNQIQPKQFPFLKNELPAEFQVEQCS